MLPREIDPSVLNATHTIAPPPAGFNPLTATEAQRASYGLPPRPDAATEPDLFVFWGKLLGPPLNILTAQFPPPPSPPTAAFTPFSVAARRIGRRSQPSAPIIRAPDHRQDSPNWSGGVITPKRPNRFMQVVGGWTVPTASVPLILPSEANPATEDFASSTWIGLGGNRPYNSLPQIGTSQIIDIAGGVATPSYTAWWQWWVRGRREHYDPVQILNMPVHPGDEMLSMVTIESPGDAHFLIKNQTIGTLVTFKVVAPANILPVGASAEWVHERPSDPISGATFPLPQFSDVSFVHCNARSVPQLGAMETPQALENARLVRMYEHFNEPFRSHYVSVPEKTGPHSLLIRYQ